VQTGGSLAAWSDDLARRESLVIRTESGPPVKTIEDYGSIALVEAEFPEALLMKLKAQKSSVLFDCSFRRGKQGSDPTQGCCAERLDADEGRLLCPSFAEVPCKRRFRQLSWPASDSSRPCGVMANLWEANASIKGAGIGNSNHHVMASLKMMSGSAGRP
jgi:hypothetical protein